MRNVGLALLVVATIGCEESGQAGSFAKAPVPRPALEGKSREPILLRYKFEPGEKTHVDMTVDTTTRVRGAARMDQKMTIAMTGAIVWSAAEAGTFTGEMTFTSARMKLDLEAQGMPSQHLDWSSDQGGGPPELEPFRAMIGPAIAIKVTDRGKITESDFQVMREALQRAGAASEMIDEVASPEVLESTFQLLPDEPVKVGDTWDAGHIVNQNQMMRAEISYQLKVAQVSGDGSQAILEAVPEVALEASGPAEIRSQKSGYDFWLRFDVGEGDVAEASNRLSMRLGMRVMGEKVDMEMDADLRYRARRE
jgi:hypothetical protein